MVGGKALTPLFISVILFYILSLRYKFIPHQESFELIGVFVLGVAIRVVIAIVDNPNPPIDLYYLTTQGFGYLIHGVNPYTATYVEPPNVLPSAWTPYVGYPPLMLVMLGFGYFLGDVRYSIVVADLAIAFLLYRFCKDKNVGLLLATIYMLNPFGVVMVQYAWNESILSAFLLASLLVLREKKNNLSAVLLGLGFGIKQFSILFAPFMWRNYKKTQILISVLIGAAIYLPFLIWSPYAIIYNLFLAFSFVRYDSRSIIPLFLRLFWSDPATVPAILRTLLSLIQYSVTGLVILRFLRESTITEKIVYNFSLSYFIFLFLSQISNINYFYLLFPFLLLSFSNKGTDEIQ